MSRSCQGTAFFISHTSVSLHVLLVQCTETILCVIVLLSRQPYLYRCKVKTTDKKKKKSTTRSGAYAGGGGGGGGERTPRIDDHGIEVPSKSEQKEPAEIDTLPSQLQSPPNLSALALIHCHVHAINLM